MKSTKLIIANWKMNPESAEEAKNIASEMSKKSKNFGKVKLVICPPFIFLNEVAKIISTSKKISLGAQDIFVGEGVSHTGEIGSEILKNANVKYVMVGHSERRASLDSDSVIREKVFGSLEESFKTILCIGEKERNEHGDYFHEIREQLEKALMGISKKLLKNLVIAYEPVWAIGRSEKEAMQPEQLHEMTIFIKRIITDMFGSKYAESIYILYGGSVTKNNAKEIIEKGNVDGLLVGRESLKAENFVELITSL